MAEDARFEDSDTPLRLMAEGAEDLEVISALLQDAVGKSVDLAWLPRARRFAVVVNRFRWERKDAAAERVQSGLSVENALRVRARGIIPRQEGTVLNVLRLSWEPTGAAEDPSGVVRLICSEGVEFAIEVEALDVRVSDITRPWEAERRPRHPEG
jgi:hypothetical protein